MHDEIQLGDVARDKITGYTGVVVAYTTWLNGCRRLSLQNRELKDGKPIEAQVFDIEQLELLTQAAPRTAAYSGGDRPDTGARPATPSR